MGRHPSIHITGAAGQLGVELQTLLPEAGAWTHAELDVTDPDAVGTRLEGAEVVVHLAAFTNVDECELRPERAFSVNEQGAANVAAAAARSGGRVVYVSTDYVFDGRKEGEYLEDDGPAPVNVYGASKLAGERRVLAYPGNLVVRTSWVYGPGRNFVDSILSVARGGSTPVAVDDQVGRPTWARDLAAGLVSLIETRTNGVVHLAGDGAPGSWADVADEALAAAGLAARATRVTTETYARDSGRSLAPRPRNSALSIDKARALGVPLRPWRESVRAYVGTSS